MSGGHFDYQQYRLEDMASEIDELISSNDDESLNQYGERRGNGYLPLTIERFKEAAHTARRAAEMIQRIDWLVSGDDGETSFMERWYREVRNPWEKETTNTTPEHQ